MAVGVSRLARVFCPDCDGASADYRLPPCDTCLNGGHLDINRAPDGSVPTHHDDGRPVRPYVDTLLPEFPRATPK